MNDMVRESYRERLSEGDIVYLAEGEGVTGSIDNPLVVKKATINSTHLDKSPRHYPFVLLWDSVDKDPGRAGFCTSKSPRELFTPQEVLRVLRDEDGPLGVDTRPVDELVADPITNKDLAIALGAATLRRMAEDFARRPHDPEY